MNIFKTFLVIILSVIFVQGAAVVSAQNSSTEDSNIQQRLEEEGLDQAPDVIEVEERQMQGQEPYSGFVDENGNPLSDAEYAEYRENQKGLFKKYPWLLPVILVGVVGSVYAVVKLRKK